MCSNNVTCPIFTKYHKLGEIGGEIPKIQQFLKSYGYYNGPISGYFDKNTENGIKEFQQEFKSMILTP